MDSTELLTVIEPDGATGGFDPGLSDAQLIHCYRTMLAVRAFDAICMKLQRGGRIGFSIPNRGIEATRYDACELNRRQLTSPGHECFAVLVFLADHAFRFATRIIVKIFFELTFNETAFFFHDKHFMFVPHKIQCSIVGQRPDHANLVSRQPDLAGHRFIDAQQFERM